MSILRAHRWRHLLRRAGLHRAVAARHPVADRGGAADAAPVLGYGTRKHPLRAAGRHRRRDRGGRQDFRCPRLYHRYGRRV